MNAVLVGIALLLIIAERLLVTYGKCRIIVNQEGEKKEFTVDGGGYLLSNLTENKIEISSSCGGKGSCGYCKVKVLEGGGEILPTEEVFMSREEKRAGMRLACQVKIKKDIEIYIPDYLETVKTIVRKRTYDPKLRWDFHLTQTSRIADPEVCANGADEDNLSTKLEVKDLARIQEINAQFRNMEGAIVPLLQKITKTYNYLPESVLRQVSKDLDIPLSLIYRIATFYSAFNLKPIGKHVITVCTGTACHVKGAEKIVSLLENELKIKRGSTTEDMLFTLKTVRCLGCCGLAPVLKVGEELYGMMNEKKTNDLIKIYRDKQDGIKETVKI